MQKVQYLYHALYGQLVNTWNRSHVNIRLQGYTNSKKKITIFHLKLVSRMRMRWCPPHPICMQLILNLLIAQHTQTQSTKT